MRVLIGCEYSGRTREAFRARGHDAISCDLLPAEDNSKHHWQCSVFDAINAWHWDLAIFHPPCTYLANSGVRWMWNKTIGLHPDTGNEVWTYEENWPRWKQMREAAEFFAKLLLAPIPLIGVENPIMHQYARRAIEKITGQPFHQQFVQPWWFGDKAFKATGFTLKGLDPLVKPPTALVPPKPGTPEHKEWSVIHNAAPGPNRWKDRSRTFPGIARAMAEQWG